MCLLITKPESTVFDNQFLAGVYDKNSDGIGIMYAEHGKVVVKKFLPKTKQESIQIYHEHIAGKACAVHYRMRTHGATDMANCHPYQVLSADEGYELWLMHNGVLHTGNDKNVAMSDTWHYIRDYLRPILLNNPTFFMTEEFKDMIGAHIGSNRFTLLDSHGNMVTVNEDQGVMYEGAWLSNTYAWDTKDRKFTYCKTSYGNYGGYGWGSSYKSALDDEYDFDYVTPYKAPVGRSTAFDDNAEDADLWVDCMEEYLTDITEEYVRIPYTALYRFYEAIGYVHAWTFLDAVQDNNYDYETIMHYIYMDEEEIREALGLVNPDAETTAEKSAAV